MAADAGGKVFVVCPAGLTTGGAELLHQLVHELRRIGRDACVSYWPFTQRHERNPAYQRYDAPMGRIEDEAGHCVVFPETLTRWSYDVRRARCIIWWLSVDNYFLFAQDHRLRSPLVYRGNRLYDPVRRLRTLWRLRRPLHAMRNMTHLAQSHYARRFLERAGIRAEMLTDYLSAEHFDDAARAQERQDVIAYNPKKGIDVTARLMQAFPRLRFAPIQNMTPAQVAAFLRSSKLYIDFGNHPGKDRPPREAVMAGCCVITGRSGAAAFEEDTPIPPAYRLDPRARDFLASFEQAALDVLGNFPARSADFDPWRERIRGERALFESQVRALFG